MAFASATLADIQNKVRMLTRSPSENQLSTTNLNQYINTFIAYDFPEHLRLFNLHTQGNFVLEPYQAEYDLTQYVDSNGNNLLNVFISINPPVYVDGYKAYYTQSRDEFYNIYPFNQEIVMIGAGDGVTQSFTYTIGNGFLLANEVQVTSITAANTGLYLADDGNGTLVSTTGDGTGTVDYVTGEIIANFSVAPAQGQPVNAHVVQYTPARPSALLYYDKTLIVRPVPDQPYTMNFEYNIAPTQLMLTTDMPQLQQWWQWIAYGAAKKVFEDRMDLESVQQIMPEYKKQEALVLRRTIVQNTTQRVATIYEQQSGLGAAFSNFYNGF